MFLRLCEAYKILNNPELRAPYDVRYRETKQLHGQIFNQAEATLGTEGEQRKRHGILELLCNQTIHGPDLARMTVFDFEQLLGCFTITVLGFDKMESRTTPLPGHHLLLAGAAVVK